MFFAACTLAASGILLGAAPDDAVGWLQPSADECASVQGAAEPYVPHEGDILLYDDQSYFWTFFFCVAGSKAPFHSAIVVKRPDGSPAVLEAGLSVMKLRVYVLDLAPHLRDYKGFILVRRCKVALTQEQSERLTAFALAQEGKPYALGRLALQLTPLRSRGVLHQHFYAATYSDRQLWMCAEIVVSAGAQVGLFDPACVKATATYPEDLLDDHLYDLAPIYEEARCWTSEP